MTTSELLFICSLAMCSVVLFCLEEGVCVCVCVCETERERRREGDEVEAPLLNAYLYPLPIFSTFSPTSLCITILYIQESSLWLNGTHFCPSWFIVNLFLYCIFCHGYFYI